MDAELGGRHGAAASGGVGSVSTSFEKPISTTGGSGVVMLRSRCVRRGRAGRRLCKTHPMTPKATVTRKTRAMPMIIGVVVLVRVTVLESDASDDSDAPAFVTSNLKTSIQVYVHH